MNPRAIIKAQPHLLLCLRKLSNDCGKAVGSLQSASTVARGVQEEVGTEIAAGLKIVEWRLFGLVCGESSITKTAYTQRSFKRTSLRVLAGIEA